MTINLPLAPRSDRLSQLFRQTLARFLARRDGLGGHKTFLLETRTEPYVCALRNFALALLPLFPRIGRRGAPSDWKG